MSSHITFLRARMDTQQHQHRGNRFALWIYAVAGVTVAIWAWIGG